jgi:hypothetical protein
MRAWSLGKYHAKEVTYQHIPIRFEKSRENLTDNSIIHLLSAMKTQND